MPLSVGTQLGSLKITERVGVGGMGEVYRARDLKLKREVAVKILPDEFSRDADRVSRFQREGEVLASLNHPNIAAIYGVEEADGVRALVLEFIEGPTLADRLARGPVPVKETLAIARQIAEAVEAAHGRGIVHRDLKPSNIKITDEGTVKVLDFGLAKASVNEASSPDLSQLPTVTNGGTLAGLIVGTPAYMSPEQLRGQLVDKRTDIWAFGVVLHEMLTGRRLFEGETISDTLAAVLTKEPDWRGVPATAQRLVRSCLEKDPKWRLRDIGDAWRLLEDVPWTAARNGAWRARAGWIAAAALLAVVAFVMWPGHRRSLPPFGGGLVRFPVYPPEGMVFYGGPQATVPVPQFALSQDGRYLVFAAGPAGGKHMLWLRPIDRSLPALWQEPRTAEVRFGLPTAGRWALSPKER